MSKLLICVDFQNDFLEGGTMEVSGGNADVDRTIEFIKNNKIDKIICSLDTHTKKQIFHKCYWKDQNGNEPDNYTIITKEDVENGKWIPTNGNIEYAIEYLSHIKSEGRKELCIWPYHCLIGTKGASLCERLADVVYQNNNLFIQKGMDPDTEMYGIIRPEYNENNYYNYEVLEAIEQYDEVYITGEASSHCVVESVKEIAEYYEGNFELLSKITVLTDCMSSIKGYEEDTEKEFEILKTKGIKLAKSTEI